MPTEIYKNWLSNIQECGLSNEQACGMAMLLAWNLTSRKRSSDINDPDIYWKFVDKSEFDLISNSSFVIDDFLNFIPMLKLAGEVLHTSMPEDRVDSENQKAELLNLDWQNEADNQDKIENINDVLCLRHRFDLLWCQEIGESLRSEIRNPIHAFVLVDYLTHGFSKFDPEGYSRILHSISQRQSPFAAMFSSRYFVFERNGLKGYEPFQIALLGFTANLMPKLGEQLWNLQRVLFYQQPEGIPINLEKQTLPLLEFIKFSLPLITDFIDLHRGSFLETGNLIATEYLYRSSEFQAFDQFFDTLDKRYGFRVSAENEHKTTTLLVNAAALYTISCLKIRNLNNKISNLPTLRALDDIGFLWARETLVNQILRDEAILCFDVMLSWRYGASWALFLETEHGFFQRAYVGDTSEYQDVDDLFSKLCVAYAPVRCIAAFWTHRLHDDKNLVQEVVFLNLVRGSVTFAEVFEGLSDNNAGRSLGDYLGFIDNQQFTAAYFPKLQESFQSLFSIEDIKIRQDELIELFPPARIWNFVDRLKELDRNDESVTYVDLESASHDGYLTSLWLLINYSNPQYAEEDLSFCSTRLLCEYDCQNLTRRFVSLQMYELPMGSGSCVHDSGELRHEASPIPSDGNSGFRAWEIACRLNPSIEFE